jgi:hypothetical protein
VKGLIYHNISKSKTLFEQYDKLIWSNSTQNKQGLLSYIKSIYPDYSWEIEGSSSEKVAHTQKIGFYLQSDTLVKSAVPILKRLSADQYIVFIPPVNKENSDQQLIKDGIPYSELSRQELKTSGVSVLVLFNDWSKLAKRTIIQSRNLGIPTLCVQESMIDFSQNKRMTFAGSVMVQGQWYLKKLNRKVTLLTGNPRYEHLLSESASLGNEVLINCNFTYGIFENVRDAWLADIDRSLNQLNQSYFISQHPRDKGDLSLYKNVISSSADSIHNQIKRAKIVVTRFSSIIHEALFYEVPVVYYNPHNEPQIENLEIDHKVIKVASNPEELNEYLAHFINHRPAANLFKDYINRNCLDTENAQLPSERIANALLYGVFPLKKNSFSDILKSVYYHPILRKLSSFIRSK